MTLHNDLLVIIRIINRTPLVHTMLCFANLAVAPNENYNVIFPPSTQWSTGHSKRDFQPWPLTNQVDVSWYKNNKNSASWFAVNQEDDFVAGYDHGKNAGTMSVADHNVVPGKKFFTWGVGNMWDKILTDNDGPYLEIMVGAYSDNQPDYSWLQPYEERAFEMNFYPFRGIDGVKNANLDAAVNLDVKDGQVQFGFYTTKAYPEATIRLKAGNQLLVEEKTAINPGKPFAKQVTVPAGMDEHDLRASISVEGRELIAYAPIRLQAAPKPVGTTNPAKPAAIQNDEELFLAGQRIDQFHNPSMDADPYWQEALRRDSGNVAANTGMGLIELKNANYASAITYFQKAIDRLTAQYTTSKNAEPFYYLGVALKNQGRLEDAFKAFYKATWSQEWKAPSYFSLAEIASLRGDFPAALDLVDHALDANALNVRAYGLKAAVLRHLGRNAEAVQLIAIAKTKCDPLDVRLMAEQWLAANDSKATLVNTLNAHPATAQEIAAEYYNAGLWSDGTTVLLQAIQSNTSTSPLVYYYLGFFAEKLGDLTKATEYRLQATLQSPDYVFPFQEELLPVLKRAMEVNPKDSKAPYYFGNLLFDLQPEEAIMLWEKSAALDPQAITLRNLAQAYSHQTGGTPKAITYLERAVALSNPDPTHFAELDNLYKSAGASVEKRLALLEKNQKTVFLKDEALGSLINLKIFKGDADVAIQLLKSRIFSIWEGGNAFNTGQAWTDAHVVRGIKFLNGKKYREALNDFQTALTPPEDLRAQPDRNSRQVQISWLTGCAYQALGEKDNTVKSWNEVVNSGARTNRQGSATGRAAGNNRSAQKEQLYYKTLAQQKLGSNDKSEDVFRELAAASTDTMSNQSGNEGDPQFVQSRSQPTRDNLAMPHYIAGLGYAGFGNKAKAREEFAAALKESPDFLSAKIALIQL